MGQELRLETEDESWERKRVSEGRVRVIGERKKGHR